MSFCRLDQLGHFKRIVRRYKRSVQIILGIFYPCYGLAYCYAGKFSFPIIILFTYSFRPKNFNLLPPTHKLWEGNVFSHGCLSVHGTGSGSYVTTTHDALGPTIQEPKPQPCTTGHRTSP